MKKRSKAPTTYSASRSAKKQPEEKTEKEPVDDEEETGFSYWLKTGQGVEFMKYFVLLNSLGVFLTMGWPTISKTYHILKSYFYEEEDYSGDY